MKTKLSDLLYQDFFKFPNSDEIFMFHFSNQYGFTYQKLGKVKRQQRHTAKNKIIIHCTKEQARQWAIDNKLIEQ